MCQYIITETTYVFTGNTFRRRIDDGRSYRATIVQNEDTTDQESIDFLAETGDTELN
jgi:hypothetical protein